MSFIIVLYLLKLLTNKICICLIQIQGREEEVDDNGCRRREEEDVGDYQYFLFDSMSKKVRLYNCKKGQRRSAGKGKADMRHQDITEDGRGSLEVEEECKREKIEQ